MANQEERVHKQKYNMSKSSRGIVSLYQVPSQVRFVNLSVGISVSSLAVSSRTWSFDSNFSLKVFKEHEWTLPNGDQHLV